MYVNNPQYNIKLIDLLDLYNIDFDYHDIYKVVKDWFETDIKPSFFIDDDILYNIFIERFCDRYYNRCLNFDTYLEFKIKLKECLNRHKLEVLQIYNSSLIEINPLITTNIETKHKENVKDEEHLHDIGEYRPNLTTTTDDEKKYGKTDILDVDAYHDKTKNSGSDTNISDGYNLHSDTPSSTMHVKDIANSSNSDYITDATNDHNKTKTEHGLTVDFDGGKRKSTTTTGGSDKGNVTSNTHGNAINDNKTDKDLQHTMDYEHLQKGYTGSPVDLLNKYSTMVFDAMTYLLDTIENDHLFSSVIL